MDRLEESGRRTHEIGREMSNRQVNRSTGIRVQGRTNGRQIDRENDAWEESGE